MLLYREIPVGPDVQKRFDDRWEVSEEESPDDVRGPCHVWTGTINPHSKYGQLYARGKVYYVHRVALALRGTPAPLDRVVDHLCRNKACCNPEHLEPITVQENARRYCKHPPEEQDGSRKLHAARAVELRERLRKGEDATRLAEEYGITESMAEKIGAGLYWAWAEEGKENG